MPTRAELMRERSQRLRSEQQPEERRLWYCFLNRYPVRFRRQVVLGDYIADFYCAKARLVIEPDGSQHYMPEGKAYDVRRDAILKEKGIEVMRFSDLQVNREFQNACEAIDLTVKRRIAVTDAKE